LVLEDLPVGGSFDLDPLDASTLKPTDDVDE